ncbi:uncharacterized protein CcaverHIS019_0505550 [Cutaneotrichosporon cavernicola]|uniref:DUF1690-domain-containing protein n=1 Tax=Cutaneotrichosporon cavernicola TaxID=279322 RepID=A0AA48QX59_9TREE|nr:uncharacterized protein CcaverHIS019_0505550 [Cutaneotrichosporon cavernicola]BEI92927.1 hypothetical protein CcaverHIS019_0505550 [Cutaneotrichosporon cavernicola]
MADKSQEQVVRAPEEGTSVEFSPSLLQRLMAPRAAAPSTDDLVRQRLAAESAALRQKEAEILGSISAALEKENLDRDKPGTSSEVLGNDIEAVREKIARMAQDKKNLETPELAAARAGVVACYKNKPEHALDCWREVDAFKVQVSKLEQAFVKSLH